jgi:quinol monooxygenase YgiN
MTTRRFRAAEASSLRPILPTSTSWITEVWDDVAAHKASLQLPSVKASITRGMPLIETFEMHAATAPVGGIGLSK